MKDPTDAERVARMRRRIEGGDSVPGGSVVDRSRSIARVSYDAGMELLPELHQTRWAEQYGKLHSERRAAVAAGDAGKVAEVMQAIQDHLKGRYDTSSTRELIETQFRHEAPEEARQFFAKHRGRGR